MRFPLPRICIVPADKCMEQTMITKNSIYPTQPQPDSLHDNGTWNLNWTGVMGGYDWTGVMGGYDWGRRGKNGRKVRGKSIGKY